MSDYDDYDDEQEQGWDGNVRSLPAGLRKHLRELEKANKAAKEELESLRKAQQQRVVKDVLAAKGVNPKVAVFAIASGVEPTEEAVGKWLEEYGDVFGASASAEPEPARPAAQPASLTQDDVRALSSMEAAQSGGVPLEVSGDLMNKIGAAASEDELNKLLGIPASRSR